MLKKALLLSSLCLFSAVSSTLAKADTIVDSALGATYTTTFSQVGTNSFDVFLLVDTTTPSGSLTTADFLNAVSLKLNSQSSTYTSVTLESVLQAPFTPGTPVTSFTTPQTAMSGGLNANGCDGSGDGFFCNEANISTGAHVKGTNDIYLFEWVVDTTAGNGLTDGQGYSLKVGYVNVDGRNVGITSMDGTLTPATPGVPEPGTFVMIGTGLLGFAGTIRKKMLA